MKEIQSRLIRVFLLAATTGLLIISFSLPQIPSSLTIPVQAQTREPGFTFNEFLIETPHFTLPFHLVNGLPLINGRVNNIPGKFLFDTGTHFAFFLNNHRLPLSIDTLRLEVGEENQLVLGYQFLKNYVTAWNYQDQTITLLKR